MDGKDNLLLHFCCGPCGPFVADELGRNFNITAFWYNPNIYPFEENERRLLAFKTFCEKKGIKYIIGTGMDSEEFNIKARSITSNGQDRCSFCYEHRLESLVKTAKALGIRFFSTTLLASFYQKVDKIRDISLRLADIHGMGFVYDKFWDHYYESKNIARDMGLYIQKYCGCGLSMVEAMNRKKNKLNK